ALLVLQSAFFAVLLMQYSDSVAFRLLIGFLGIGLLIVMPVMGLARYGTEKGAPTATYLALIAVIMNVVLPWVPVAAVGFGRGSIAVMAVPAAALSLGAAIGGSAVNAIRISATNPDGAAVGMRAARWALSLVVLLMALNLVLPAFARLAAWLAPAVGIDVSWLAGMVAADRMWQAIFLSIHDILLWMLNFCLAFWSSVRFYRVFLSKDGI
nr:hypothetical protein [Spirochaetota bacterium]